MAIEKAGVILVAEGYEEYMNRMRNVAQANQQAFGGTTGATRNVQQTTQAVGGLSNALGVAKTTFVALGTAMAAFKAIDIVRDLIGFAQASAKIAMRNETLGVSLQQVGRSAGYTAEQIAWAEQSVKNMGITTQAARQSLIRIAQANIEFADASKLARIAQDAAVIGNINSSEAFERMIYGIQSGQVEILRTMNLNVNFMNSYRAMAQQRGKNVLELNEEEKAQARVNAVMAAGERIVGAYEAAMGTAGKQQNTMARYIEETQYKIGKLMMPWEELKISMETAKWKAFDELATGFSALEPIIRATIDRTKEAGDVLGSLINKLIGWEPEDTFWDKLAEGAYNSIRFTVMQLELLQATVAVVTEKIMAHFVGLGLGIKEALAGNLKGAVEIFREAERIAAQPFGERMQDYFVKGMTEWLEKYPEWEKNYKGYKDSLKATEASLERHKTLQDLAIEGLDKEAKSLEAVGAAMKDVEKIQRQYDKGVKSATEDRNKQIARLDADLQKDRLRAADKYARDMAKAEEQYNRDIVEAHKQNAKDMLRAQADLQRDLRRMQEQFQLEQRQGQRRFELDQRRLVAAGDVLGLIQLREDYAIEQETAKENYNQERKIAEEDGNEKLRRQQEDMQEQINNLGVTLEQRRADLTQSYQDELTALQTANQERRIEIQANYLEQLEDLKTSRDDQLILLAESLQDQGIVTQQGMTRLQGILNSLFGPDMAGDRMMQAWTERSKTAIQFWADNIAAEMGRIGDMMDQVAAGGDIPWKYVAPKGQPPPSWKAPENPQTPTRMRTGGVGVVTGPRVFEVEPGRREFFMFAPMRGGRSMTQTINAVVSGGIDIRGGENASQSVVNAAVTATLGELREAIKRRSRS